MLSIKTVKRKSKNKTPGFKKRRANTVGRYRSMKKDYRPTQIVVTPNKIRKVQEIAFFLNQLKTPKASGRSPPGGRAKLFPSNIKQTMISAFNINKSLKLSKSNVRNILAQVLSKNQARHLYKNKIGFTLTNQQLCNDFNTCVKDISDTVNSRISLSNFVVNYLSVPGFSNPQIMKTILLLPNNTLEKVHRSLSMELLHSNY